MSILQKIRERTWILIAVVALAIVAFLIEPGTLIQNLKQINPNQYGTVNDRVITREDYDQAYLMVSQGNPQADPAMVKNQAWETAIENKLIHIQAEKAGLEVNEEVLFNYFPEIQTQLAEIRARADQGDKQAADILNRVPQTLKAQIDGLRNNLYQSLLTTTFLTNKLEAQHMKKNFSEMAVVDMVKVDYDKYNEKNPVTVTDEDLQKYINEHPNLFKKDATVNIHYVHFPDTPSANDKALFEKNMQAFMNGGVLYDIEDGKVLDSVKSFASVTNDSIYVGEYSLQNFNPMYLGTQQIAQFYSPELSQWVKSAGEGAIYGPYTNGNSTILSKLTGKKMLDSIQAKQIVLGYAGGPFSGVKRTKEEALSLANQLVTQLKANPASFSQVAASTSDDDRTAAQGGNMGWITENVPIPELLTYLKTNPVGSIGVLELTDGYHVIQIDNKKQGQSYQLANLVREQKSSEETESLLYDKANKYFSEVKDQTLQDMVNVASKNKYDQNDVNEVTRMQGVLTPLNSEKDEDIISWAFDPDREVGNTNIFNSSNGDYIIVRLTGKSPKGMATPAQIKDQYETIVRNQKLAESAKAKFKGLSLNQLATDYQGVISTDSLSMAQMMVPGNGREPKVVGAAFGLKTNQTSSAVGGTSGIYKMTSKGKATKPINIDDQSLKNQLGMQDKQYSQIILQSLRREAEVDDERGKLMN